MRNQIFNHLKGKLSLYGLNPLDWEIRTVYKEQCILVHRHDPGLKLYGQILEGRGDLAWEKLYFENF